MVTSDALFVCLRQVLAPWAQSFTNWTLGDPQLGLTGLNARAINGLSAPSNWLNRRHRADGGSQTNHTKPTIPILAKATISR